jgi:hypothetical protein
MANPRGQRADRAASTEFWRPRAFQSRERRVIADFRNLMDIADFEVMSQAQCWLIPLRNCHGATTGYRLIRFHASSPAIL